MRIIGALLLLPLVGAFWVVVTVAKEAAKKGGSWRLLGVLSSLVIGGVCVLIGYWLGSQEGWVFGWVLLVGGGLMAVLGSWMAMSGTDEKRQQATWQSAQEEAKSVLQQDRIYDYEKSRFICSILARNAYDNASFELYQRMSAFEWQSATQEAEEIVRRGDLGSYEKKEVERVDLILHILSQRPSSVRIAEELGQLRKLTRSRHN